MAKTQIKNYVFEPGLGISDNLYPNAYDLLNRNKSFLVAEATAYINQEIIDAVKCRRDIGYLIDGVGFDVALGTNYNALFLGRAESYSIDNSKTVFRTIERTKTAVAALSLVAADATALSRSNEFFTEVVDIMTNGTGNLDALSLSIPGTASANQIAVATKLATNTTFLRYEIAAWLSQNYPSYDYNLTNGATTGSLDVKYAIQAATYDTLYGGNSASFDSAKLFPNSTAAGAAISGSHQTAVVAAYARLKIIIDQVVKGEAVTVSTGNFASQDLTGTNADSATGTAVAALIDITSDVAETGASTLDALTRVLPSVGWVSAGLQGAKLQIVNNKTSIVEDVTWDPTYTYNQSKCERDVGYVIDAYLNDLRYGGDETLYNTVKYYWDNGVAQVDGNRIPEIDTHAFLGDLIADNILTNTVYAKLGAVLQVIDATKTAEAVGVSTLATLVGKTVTVITSGIYAFGAYTHSGIGTIKIQGRFTIDEILIVTNVTDNIIIYNFADIQAGATATIKDYGSDDDFVTWEQTTDAVTTLKLKFNTSTMSETDELQIFVERMENGKSIVTTRPYDFGTDAIERNRTADPISMLDADFEYGLQPTKWSAIGMMRGYPSIYEIPGTDAEVVSVVTDASTGTEGIGASLITVTTVAAHGYSIGTPITIKALEAAISGAARAEGSFVIIDIPTAQSFQYYAKSKVGITNNTELSAGYTQLRQGGFYTGAGIDGAEFTLVSNGSSGTMFVELTTPIGANTIPFDGTTPEIGSPITNASIPVGSQVTSVISNSAGGGDYLTLNVGQNADVGDTTLELFDATGVLANLALDRGDGTSIFINSVVNSTVSLSGALTSAVVANSKTYAGITAATIQPVGVGLLLNITRTGGNYSVDGIFGIGGLNYVAGDKFKILGSLLGGVDVVNDMSGVIGTINASGSVQTVTTIAGTAVSGTASLTGLAALYQGGDGTDALFNITTSANAFIVQPVGGGANVSLDYVVGDRLKVLGTVFNGGVDSTNDVIIEVTGIDVATGQITTVSSSGTAPDADVLFEDVTTTSNTAAGSGATFDIRMIGAVYTSINIAAGADYVIGETFTVSGNDLNGGSPANDLTITIDNVGGSGDITAVSSSGTGSNTEVFNGQIATNIIGTGALFNVALASSAYTVTVDAGGTNWFVGQTFKILGNILQGSTPANDLTITVASVDAAGTIQTITSSGTGSNGTVSYTEAQPVNIGRPGTGSTWNITRADSAYSNIDTIDNGSAYEVGDKLKIIGTLLDGQNTTHDIIITVDTVTGGAIDTFTVSGTEASPGTTVALVCTFTMTEATTGILNVDDVIPFSALATFEVNFPNAHGLVPGDTFIVSTSTDDGSNNHKLANGAFLAINMPSKSSLRYNARAPGAVTEDENTDPINATIYARPDSFFVHRPFDGGVQLGTGGPQHGAQAIRQSKKYIRYQSGKGIMYTTGALFAPSYDLQSISSSGTEINSLITVTTDDNDHGVQAGGVIRILGVETPGYNSGQGNSTPPWFDYTVEEVLDERSFTVRAKRRLGDTTIVSILPNIESCPLVVAFTEAAAGTNTNQIHNFLINTIATDGYAYGDVTQSGSFTSDDTSAVTNYLNGVSQTATLTARILLMITELKARRNTGAVEDTIKAFTQEASIGFGAQMSVVAWHGATVRSGIFDDQNGIFWEFDGTNISVNQRTGTQQVAGTITMASDSNLITGTNTRFRDQLSAGDRVIIRGMTHVVSHVNTQTNMTVTPDFRGINDITGAKINLVVDKKVKQANFNLDTLDGNGPSGYDIDIAKMQMIGIQYSWYGAGFIDYMLRGADGNFVFCHRMRNSNVNTEAFMRSGNLPVRYEVTNEGPPGKLAADITNSQNTLELIDGSFFPEYGTVYVDNEIIAFTGRSSNHLTGLTRGGTLTNFQAGAERTYSAGAASPHTKGTGVVLISQTITPLISHWGSAFITDGGFDSDRGYIFSYAETGVEVTTTKQTAFMIRLAPSVSNAIIGDLGERELLNRAQLLLQGLEVTSDGTDDSDALIKGGIIVEGVLNPQNYPLNPNDVGWGGLSGVAQGGQPSFAQIAGGGSITWSTGDAATFEDVNTFGATDVTNSTYYNGWRGANFLYMNKSQYDASPFAVGSIITGSSRIRTGTTVTGVNTSDSNQVFVNISRSLTGYINSGTSLTFSFGEDLTNRNFAYVTKSSFDTAGAGLGTSLYTHNSINWPANSQISAIEPGQHGSDQYYKVSFNNTFTGTLVHAGPGVVRFEFVQPPYAQPGETVFSFIAVPGERATVDFSELKELTNTPLGGRGTFPNGPDVLAINVYKVSGTAVDANLILKWGEAQA